MSLSVLFFRGGGAGAGAIYVDAPFERYVWAPPDVRDFEALGPPIVQFIPPTAPLIARPPNTALVVREPDRIVFRPEERIFIA
jgi:hypothetical protein